MKSRHNLTKESKEKLKNLLKKEKKKLETSLFSQIRGSIKSTIETDKSEIKDIGIIVCAFEYKKAPYSFIRTEPLIYFKEKNFDVLLFGEKTKTIVLISIKESLVSSPQSKINELKNYSEDVQNNVEINNTIANQRMKIINYFESIVKNTITFQDYVLACRLADQIRIRKEAQKIGFDFCLWQLSEKNARLNMVSVPIIGNNPSFIGHRDKELRKYLRNLGKSRGIPYSDLLTFIYSSSRYLKSVSISVPLYKTEGNYFDYEKWRLRFKTDLINWHEEEKQIVYKNYIDYGLKCRFVKCIVANHNILKNQYSIKSKYSKTSAFIDDIINKMIKYEVAKQVKSHIPELKKQLTSQILIEQAKKSGIKPLKIN